MVFNETQPMNEWTCQHLDKIMKQADWLYTNLQRDNSYPLISSIPKSIWLGCILNEIQTGATIFGPLHSENFTFSRLDDITSSLAKYNIVTIDSHVPAYWCALILDDLGVLSLTPTAETRMVCVLQMAKPHSHSTTRVTW